MALVRERKFTEQELFETVVGLLLENGYAGFNFSILANRLNVSRGTLYKYYSNKDDLISNVIISELTIFLEKLTEIRKKESFEEQLEGLFDLMFENNNINVLMEMGHYVLTTSKMSGLTIKEQLEKLHQQLYKDIEGLIQ